MDESKAVAQLKQGDIGGLEELVQLYQIKALDAAYIISRDRALAEDIVQAAFVRAFERIQQFDSSRAFGPWFMRSVVNDALWAVHQHARHASLEASPYTDEDSLVSDDPDLDTILLQAETKEAVWATLDRLSPQQRAALVMRYYLGMSEAEMSSQLDCPPGTVKRRLHDARQRMRQLLPAWLHRPARE